MIFARFIQKTIFSFLLVGVVLAFTACQAPSSDVYAQRKLKVKEIVHPEIPPDIKVDFKQEEAPRIEAKEDQWITIDGGQRDFQEAKADIIFAIDDSLSMKSTQDNLSRNINKFISGFSKNKTIDFRVGVLTVWDSKWNENVPNKSGYGKGELRWIKNGKGQTLKSRYVSRFDGFEQSLAASLKVGIFALEDGGPENEEILSPLSAALKKTGRGAVNEDFFKDREEAHLIVVLVTDADDASSIEPEDLAKELFAFKGNNKNKVSAYGVLVRKSDPEFVMVKDRKTGKSVKKVIKDYGLWVDTKNNPQCFDTVETTDSKGKVVSQSKKKEICAGGLGPDRIDRFIIAANPNSRPEEVLSNQIFSLNKPDFGDDLARIGAHMTRKVLQKEIVLEQFPLYDQKGNLLLRVRYGTPEELEAGQGQVVPMDENAGWIYSNGSVFISGDAKISYKAQGRFAIDMVPAPL